MTHLKTETITNPKRKRRAIELSELRQLLETTAGAETRFGMTGQQRALLYRLAVETGLRSNELRTLTVRAFDLDGCTVTVEAAYSKDRRECVQPIRPDTAAVLRPMLASKTLEAKAFSVPEKTAKMLRADLADAKIDYIDEAGRVFDFHSLRHQTATLLKNSNVSPKDAQTFLRHKSIALTMEVYTHTLKGAEAAAARKLPDLSTQKKSKIG